MMHEFNYSLGRRNVIDGSKTSRGGWYTNRDISVKNQVFTCSNKVTNPTRNNDGFGQTSEKFCFHNKNYIIICIDDERKSPGYSFPIESDSHTLYGRWYTDRSIDSIAVSRTLMFVQPFKCSTTIHYNRLRDWICIWIRTTWRWFVKAILNHRVRSPRINNHRKHGKSLITMYNVYN